MSLDITQKIQELPQEKQKEFYGELLINLNDDEWCMTHALKYSNPNVQKAKEILFQEKYSKS